MMWWLDYGRDRLPILGEFLFAVLPCFFGVVVAVTAAAAVVAV